MSSSEWRKRSINTRRAQGGWLWCWNMISVALLAGSARTTSEMIVSIAREYNVCLGSRQSRTDGAAGVDVGVTACRQTRRIICCG